MSRHEMGTHLAQNRHHLGTNWTPVEGTNFGHYETLQGLVYLAFRELMCIVIYYIVFYYTKIQLHINTDHTYT